MIFLQKELYAHGCNRARDTFENVAQAAHRGLYPDWTDEEVLCHPLDAMILCRYVRVAVQAPGLPDQVILHAPLNKRKRS